MNNNMINPEYTHRCTKPLDSEICMGYRKGGLCETIENCGYRKERITNYTHIKKMSVEEMAEFISSLASECESNTACNQGCYGCNEMFCVQTDCLNWLNSEHIK